MSLMYVNVKSFYSLLRIEPATVPPHWDLYLRSPPASVAPSGRRPTQPQSASSASCSNKCGASSDRNTRFCVTTFVLVLALRDSQMPSIVLQHHPGCSSLVSTLRPTAKPNQKKNQHPNAHAKWLVGQAHGPWRSRRWISVSYFCINEESWPCIFALVGLQQPACQACERSFDLDKSLLMDYFSGRVQYILMGTGLKTKSRYYVDTWLVTHF